jgi:tight adherence protein C
MSDELITITVGVTGLILSVGWLVIVSHDRYSVRVGERLRNATGKKHDDSILRPVEKESDFRLSNVPEVLNKLLPDSDQDRKKYQLRLVHAGIYNSSALSAFFAAKLILMILPPCIGIIVGLLGFADLRMAALVGCGIGGLGMFLPSCWVDRRIRARHSVLRRSLADFLDLMIVCLDSGLSIQAAIQRVSDELQIAHPLLAGELGIVQRDIELGATADAAIRRFADRSGFDGIKLLSSFMRESQRFGSALSEALRVHADMLRVQREQYAEEQAQKASVKVLLPTLLLILPAVFVVVAGPAVIQIQSAFSKPK